MSAYEHISLTFEEGVVRLRMCRPVTLSGEGEGFSSGAADLSGGASSAGGAGFDAGDVLEHPTGRAASAGTAVDPGVADGAQCPAGGREQRGLRSGRRDLS